MQRSVTFRPLDPVIPSVAKFVRYYIVPADITYKFYLGAAVIMPDASSRIVCFRPMLDTK